MLMSDNFRDRIKRVLDVLRGECVLFGTFAEIVVALKKMPELDVSWVHHDRCRRL